MTFKLDGLDHVALRVQNVEASVAWYRDVLGLEPMFEGIWEGPPRFLGTQSGD